MSQLVIVHDTFSGSRETVDLYCGESLASNLRRIWPRGITGPWRIYRDVASVDTEIAATDLPGVVVSPFQVYVLVRGVGAAAVPFFINLFIAIALRVLSSFFAPKGRKSDELSSERSPNNALAGQSNQLRAGARIPELLGKVRSYPDLLCAPIEEWTERRQQITQWFVVGMGEYDLQDARLGDTPTANIEGATAQPFPPLTPVGPILSCRESPEVQSISLDLQEESTAPLAGAIFTAPNLLTLTNYLSVTVGQYIAVSGTLSNNKVFQVTAIPPDSTTTPFVYTLGGPAVVSETGSTPTITVMTQIHQGHGNVVPIIGSTWGTNEIGLLNIGIAPVVGNLYEIDTTIYPGGIYKWTGFVTSVNVVSYGGPPPTFTYWEIHLTDLNGVPIIFNDPYPTTVTNNAYVKEWSSIPVDPGGGTGTGDTEQGQFTSWFVVPHDPPDEIWIDLAFPQGLMRYEAGVRKTHSVSYRMEFRRQDVPGTVVNRTVTRSAAVSAPLRWTEQYTLAELLLPATSGRVECRVRRVSPISPDTSTIQYIHQTQWKRLQGVKSLPQRHYPDVTVIGLVLTNSRSAGSLGQQSFNILATRKLPTWTGSAWTAAAATERWADAFVARCKAADGANKTDAQIDLAGIYALQAQLDALDAGDQGKISITLDQSQDIDSELTQLADVVRAQVYRVGKKLFATRDQSTATRLALFNGRTKDPDGEGVQIRMTNEGENDGVTVTWLDQENQFKIREFTYTTKSLCVNPARIGAFCTNWAQAYRRAVFEWNRLRYRREQINVSVTEDGRICRPGDVVNITDDIANLAATAGEVLQVSVLVLLLDRDVEFVAGHSYSILLRDVLGQATDIIPVSAVAGAANQVLLSRAPVTGVTIKGRDTAMGTLYAFYDDSAAIVRPWLLTAVSMAGPYVQLQGVNYSELVFAGDSVTLPEKPPLTPTALGLPPGF